MERVAALLLQIPLASAYLRHTSLQSSLGYIHALPGDGPELAFIKDILTLGTNEIIDRWFGGPVVAGAAAAGLMDDVIKGCLGKQGAAESPRR